MAIMVDPGYPDGDRGSQLAATYIAGCAISLLFVIMRLCARWSIAGVGTDDWCMLVTWIVFVPLTALVSMFSFSGGTRHLIYLLQDPQHTIYVVRLNWIAQPLCIFCLGAGKISISLLILRLLNRASVWRRYSLYFASSLTIVNTILMIVLTFAQCEDVNALWDESVKSKTRCWDPKVQSSFSIYGAAVHAAMDFFLALVPVSLVWGLKISTKRKAALCGLLGCGSLTGICAAIKTSKLLSLNARSDFTWETFSLFLWTGIEIILIIVLGSIPALKPMYAICMGRRPLSMRSSQRYTHSKKSQPRRSYARQISTDTSVALGNVSTPSTSTEVVAEGRRGRDSDAASDEIGLAVSVNYGSEKASGDGADGGMGRIQVTRTIEIA